MSCQSIKLGRQTAKASRDVFQHGGAVLGDTPFQRKTFIFVREDLALCGSYHSEGLSTLAIPAESTVFDDDKEVANWGGLTSLG
ncbi:hypothetical protein LRP30_03165 [Bradyrhizobium sp. C-145]|uniref:hypothetical protein n=1 Tax=Bradyrhizobium sp. C-145 TaxID=574727 RepID=UPI00201B7779|nr:hypothetical protein [Bradyrhizobium sp. C-145]MCP1912679.1 hypothetical protein [Bradyrhizobium elkanii]UQR64333.1 hypothetical protein LRP30_03165 [Bradyrhizobium sp. C-145]